MIHTLGLVNAAKRIIKDQGLQVWTRDGEALYHVQSAYEELCGRFAAVDDGHLLLFEDFSYTAPTAPETRVAINIPYWFETIKEVEALDATGKPIVGCVPVDQLHGSYAYSGNFTYHMRGSQLIIDSHGAGGGRTTTIRVYAYRSPANLVVIKPKSSTTTTVEFPTEAYQLNSSDPYGRVFTMDGYYNSTQWVVVSGPGQGTVFEIESFESMVGSLLAGTSFPLDTTLTEDSIIAMVPSVPERAQRIIPWIAAGEGATIDENVTANSLIRNKEKSLWKDFENTMTVRQVQSSRTFNPQE